MATGFAAQGLLFVYAGMIQKRLSFANVVEALRAANLGRKLSEESRAKLSAAQEWHVGSRQVLATK